MKKTDVPKLKLTNYQPYDFSSDDESSDSDCNIVHKIHILCNNISEMQNESDLAKMHNIYEAKQELNLRDDIIIYMTADDLIRLRNNGKKTYLRLCIEHPHRSKSSTSSPSLSPKISPKSSKITSKSDSSKLDSPKSTDSKAEPPKPVSKNDIFKSNLIRSEPPPRPKSEIYKTEISPVQVRPNGKRSNSLNSNNNINIHRHLKTTTSVSSSACTVDTIQKNIVLNDIMYTINYDKTEIGYSIFIIERKELNDKELSRYELNCTGKNDSQIRSSDLKEYKTASIKYKYLENNITLTVYAPELSNLTFPLYYIITTDNFECKTDQFVDMIEDLIKLAHIEYAKTL